MDIQHLVDRLEDLIDDGRHLFGTKYTMIDEERALEIIDQMRISIPEEIEKASRILQQRDRVMAEANEEAARIIQQSRVKGEQLIERDATVQAAQTKADAIIEQARQEAAKITQEADTYVLHVLGKLEQELIKNLSVVRNGITEVQQPAPQANAQQQPQAVQMPNTLQQQQHEMVDAGMPPQEQKKKR